MKQTLLLLFALLLFACQESLDERCEREAKEFTRKKCPVPIGPNTTIDSLVFDRPTHTLHYYYTLSGLADDEQLVLSQNPRERLLKQVKNEPSLKAYKDAGFHFAYIYYSQKEKGKKLFEATFTEKDYGQKK